MLVCYSPIVLGADVCECSPDSCGSNEACDEEGCRYSPACEHGTGNNGLCVSCRNQGGVCYAELDDDDCCGTLECVGPYVAGTEGYNPCSRGHCCPSGYTYSGGSCVALDACEENGASSAGDNYCQVKDSSKPNCCGSAGSGHCEECCNNADCGFCKKCSSNSCENQGSNQDLKDECPDGVCTTGNCNGHGACGFTPADEEDGCPVCQECGEFGFCINIYDNDIDNVGSNRCDGTCQACHSGSCGFANVGTDPGDDCAASASCVGFCRYSGASGFCNRC